ncbi:hypothetical protein AGLY_011344 [Aphis glycines]|uniref:Uncharacterized protein n=1 Tax=Aphis glycines TaxID=307491 RepID=A0A6G0TDK2_APHGL|nr:hypothetical protein AGLY_011344 [Aphis glycines]
MSQGMVFEDIFNIQMANNLIEYQSMLVTKHPMANNSPGLFYKKKYVGKENIMLFYQNSQTLNIRDGLVLEKYSILRFLSGSKISPFGSRLVPVLFKKNTKVKNISSNDMNQDKLRIRTLNYCILSNCYSKITKVSTIYELFIKFLNLKNKNCIFYKYSTTAKDLQIMTIGVIHIVFLGMLTKQIVILLLKLNYFLKHPDGLNNIKLKMKTNNCRDLNLNKMLKTQTLYKYSELLYCERGAYLLVAFEIIISRLVASRKKRFKKGHSLFASRLYNMSESYRLPPPLKIGYPYLDIPFTVKYKEYNNIVKYTLSYFGITLITICELLIVNIDVGLQRKRKGGNMPTFYSKMIFERKEKVFAIFLLTDHLIDLPIRKRLLNMLQCLVTE